jgi:ParB family chromosome partitioning protein
MPPRKKRPKKGTVGLSAEEVAEGSPPDEIEKLAAAVARDSGRVLSVYRDPYGSKWMMLASLPLETVEATPYQRELSKAHVKRLEEVIPKVGRFLDPVVAIRHGKGYWTPNGMHRLEAMRRLGAKSILALVVPDREVAFRILALNTEKAHNLRDRSLEVVRMARGIAASAEGTERAESDWAFEFEEPAYLTLGLCYETNARFAGGAYMPVVRRCEEFSREPIRKSLAQRRRRAAKLLKLDRAVTACVARLKRAGIKSSYLKPFVVAQINPLRWIRAPKPGQRAPRADFDETIEKMLEKARAFDARKVRPQDLARIGAPVAGDEG